MRLLNVHTKCLEEFNEEDVPKYAILSHRWQDEEISFKDLEKGTAHLKKGFLKLNDACKTALSDRFSHIWIDTCCIDKSSSAELSEAINSMYRWYGEAEQCYAYLFDVEYDATSDKVEFERSEWFTRAWTLQELIAPSIVVFLDRNWRKFGTRARLVSQLTKITSIPAPILNRKYTLDAFSVAERMTWASNRKATRKEDIAYSLLGIFDINMPMLYGEGARAFRRLQEEIIKQSSDPSIFAWTNNTKKNSLNGRLLACSPAEFGSCGIIGTNVMEIPFSINNVGLDIELALTPWAMNTYFARFDPNRQYGRIGILLEFNPRRRSYRRVSVNGEHLIFCVSAVRERIAAATITKRILISSGKGSSGSQSALGEGFYGYGISYHQMIEDVEKQSGNLRTWLKCRTENENEDRLLEWTDGPTPPNLETRLNMLPGHRGWVGALAVAPQVTTAEGFEMKQLIIMKVGFDFNFNPICLVQGRSRKGRFWTAARLDEILTLHAEDLEYWLEKTLQCKRSFKNEWIEYRHGDSETRTFVFKSIEGGAILARIEELGLALSVSNKDAAIDGGEEHRIKWVAELWDRRNDDGNPVKGDTDAVLKKFVQLP